VTHALSQVDASARRACCAGCGRVVDVIKNGHGGWRCAEANKKRHKDYSDRGRNLPHLRHRRSSCQWCGFTPAVIAGRPVLGMIHVHHQDRDRTNNAPENLVSICSHCHAMEHATDSLRGPLRLSERIRILLGAFAEFKRRAA
jgi:hypothetical protein